MDYDVAEQNDGNYQPLQPYSETRGDNSAGRELKHSIDDSSAGLVCSLVLSFVASSFGSLGFR